MSNNSLTFGLMLYWRLLAATDGLLLPPRLNDLQSAEAAPDALNARSIYAFRTHADMSMDRDRHVTLQAGTDCDPFVDCIGGECRLDIPTAVKTCSCPDRFFRYAIASGINVCLKCRELTAFCSFDHECQCADANAVCDATNSTEKGHCKCKASYISVLDQSTGSATCGRRGGVDSSCQAIQECSHITFVDSQGNPLAEGPSQAETADPEPRAVCLFRPIRPTLFDALPDRLPVNTSSEKNISSHQRIMPDAEPLNDTATAWDGDFMVSEAGSGSVGGVVPQTRSRILSAIGRNTSHSVPISGTCQCPEGFLASLDDNLVCRDVNECADDLYNPCNPLRLQNSASVCVNLPGSYRCECNSTFAIHSGVPPSGICCMEGYIPCLDSTKCIPLQRLCNGVPDCTLDCSDELYPFCNFNTYRPFPDFAQYPHPPHVTHVRSGGHGELITVTKQCHEMEDAVPVNETDARRNSTGARFIIPPPPVISFHQSDSAAEEVQSSTMQPELVSLGLINATNDVVVDPDQSELLPLGAGLAILSERQFDFPPQHLPTLPSNITAARLLGYTLI